MFMADAIVAGKVKWTKAKRKGFDTASSQLPKQIKSLREDFMLASEPNIPLDEDGNLDHDIAAMLAVALSARFSHWTKFVEKIEAEYGRESYMKIILNMGELKSYHRVCLNDRQYLVAYFIQKNYFDNEIVDFVRSSYFDNDYGRPKITYMETLKKLDKLRRFIDSKASMVQYTLAYLLPKNDLVYILNSKDPKTIKVLEQRLA